jgi:pyruvate dehydrogenase E2 component (dihydrolipoamide acetyltransferase)
MIEEIRVPDIGENVETGEVVEVLVKAGDKVEVDDVIIEFETDKAMVEIPSPVKGEITELLVKVGDELKIGDVIAKVDTEAQAAEQEAAEIPEIEEKVSEQKQADVSPEKEIEETGPEVEPETKEDAVETASIEREQDFQEPERPLAAENDVAAGGWVPASPSVRRLARELGVDLKAVTGSAPGGRISETDIKHTVKQGRAVVAKELSMDTAAIPEMPDFSRWGDIEAVDLSKVRRLTVESTSRSWHQIPHVTQFDQADISMVEAFIQKNSAKVQKNGGKLTITAILARVCAEALQKFPHFNASLDLAHQKIILKKYVHIGMMVDTPRGLLVPVIRNAERKTIVQLAADIADLAHRARNKKIKPDEMQGGSFSISNQGGLGGTAFTPIVLWPQVAILGVSQSTTMPLYMEGEFKPRAVLPLSLSYDHRLIDGADAARFLRWICDSLRQPLNLFLD